MAGRSHRDTAIIQSSADEVKRTRELNYAENARQLGISVDVYMKLTEAYETTRELSNFHRQVRKPEQFEGLHFILNLELSFRVLVLLNASIIGF